MKNLFLLVLVGAVVAVGVNFFGLWPVPGLEKFPTVEDLGKARQGSIEAEAQRRVVGGEEAPPAGPLGVRADGGLGKRSGLLRESGRSLGD